VAAGAGRALLVDQALRLPSGLFSVVDARASSDATNPSFQPALLLPDWSATRVSSESRLVHKDVYIDSTFVIHENISGV
jgi:hypothetical protein